MVKKPELLLPAGDMDNLRVAVDYGADAVYIGGEAFGLRAKAGNFGPEAMKDGINYARSRGVKVYVTANILAHNRDLEPAREYFCQLRDMGSLAPDALIVADPGMFDLAREAWPEVELHISTQANNTNAGTFLFWHRLGAKRVVTARELSLEEIGQIRSRVPEELEIETFVHGSMCIAYSGRCAMSSYMAGRDANRGACTHPCRWKYALVEEKRPGEYWPVEENDRGTFVFNSKDMCLLGHIPRLMASGIDSWKIEGRMKTPLYVAAVARSYRRAIDVYLADPEQYALERESYLEEAGHAPHRPYGAGFLLEREEDIRPLREQSGYGGDRVFLGICQAVERSGDIYKARIFQKNKFCQGDGIEIVKRRGWPWTAKARVLYIEDANGGRQPSAPHPGQELWVALDAPVEQGELLRAVKA